MLAAVDLTLLTIFVFQLLRKTTLSPGNKTDR